MGSETPSHPIPTRGPFGIEKAHEIYPRRYHDIRCRASCSQTRGDGPRSHAVRGGMENVAPLAGALDLGVASAA